MLLSVDVCYVARATKSRVAPSLITMTQAACRDVFRCYGVRGTGLHYYHHLLLGDSDIPLVPTRNLFADRAESLGINMMAIGHTVCPGFDVYQGEHRAAWDALTFYIEGHNWAAHGISQTEGAFDPSVNPDTRIALIYRNPLDQARSFFRHALNHVDPAVRHRIDETGATVGIRSVSDYLHTVGLDAYLKQYLTFHLLQNTYPDQILMLPYEELVARPQAAFTTMLEHFGHEVSPARGRLLERAIHLASMDSMRKVEAALGHTIANDQRAAGESHMRDGSAGGWRKHLSASDVEKVDARLRQFGLSIGDFRTEV